MKRRPAHWTFKVRLQEFASELVAHILRCVPEGAVNAELWASVLAQSGRGHEVELLEASWTKFELTNPHVGLPSKPNFGKPAKAGWRELCQLIGSYILKHCNGNSDVLKPVEAAEEIYTSAKAQNVYDLPAASTIKDALQTIKSGVGRT